MGEVVNLRGRIGFRGYKEIDLVTQGNGAITFSPADINDFGYVSIKNNKYLSWQKYEESPEIKVKIGDILFTKTASIGKVGYVRELKEKATINPQFALLTPNNNTNGYFTFLSVRNKNFINQVKGITGGSSVPTMSQEKLKELTFMTPNFSEQQCIGKFYQNLDNLITLHHRKYITFFYSWEQRKLKELCNIYDGTHQTPNYKDSGIMFLSVENIKDLNSNKYISYEDFKNNFKVYPEKNDILMTRIGDIGTTNIVKENSLKAYYVSLALLKCRSINPYYLNFAIKSDYVQNCLKLRSLLTAIPMKINKDQIGEVDIKYPIDPEEQSNIGKVFDNLDNLITLHQHKELKRRNDKNEHLRW